MNKPNHILMTIFHISWAFSWRLALINILAIITTVIMIGFSVSILDLPQDSMKDYAKVIGFVIPFCTTIFLSLIIIKKRYSNFSISIQSHADSEIQEISWNMIVRIWWSIYWRIFIYVMTSTAFVMALVMLIAYIFNPGMKFLIILIPVLLIPSILFVIFLVYKRALHLKYLGIEV